MVLLILFVLSFGTTIFSQTKKYTYKIIQGGDEVGFLTLTKKDSGLSTFLQMKSEATKKIVFLVTIYELQTAVIEKGQIKFSSVYRKVNSSVKTNKYITATSNGYELYKNGEKEKINLTGIRHNQLTLYYEEPTNFRHVYSDQFEAFLFIKRITENQYQIELPDGNTNNYTYKNGILIRMKLKHTFFSAEFILTKTE